MDHPHNTNPNLGNIITPLMPFFIDDFTLQEFVDQQLNFEMIAKEAPYPINNYLINDSNNGINPLIPSNMFCGSTVITPEVDVFTNFNSPTVSCTDSTILNPFLGLDDEMMMMQKRGGGGGGDEDDENDDEDEDEDEDEDNNSGEAEQSSATATTTTTTTTTKKGKVDRSRTLISERRRRGRMKEKLYALRALVPNITKMDKASIVGDAVVYLEELQMKAKKLKSEVEGLQTSFKAAQRRQLNTHTKIILPTTHFIPLPKTIIQMDVHQIEDRELYVKVVTNKGKGVVASLYKALESFTDFTIQNSNLTTVSDRCILTFTFSVGKFKEGKSLANLKLWITGAFLNQGFEFI